MRPARIRGYIRPPSPAEVKDAAARNHMRLTDAEACSLAEVLVGVCETIDTLDELDQPTPPVRHHHRDPGGRPSAADDPLNLFIRRCDVRGAEDGPLHQVTVGLKDNLAVAGVPLTNGSRMLPYVPTMDAVVVERLLDAGAVITGMLNMDDFAASGSGESSAYGPPLNPVDHTRSCGGSSGGCAAAVASGAVDVALGVDEGGSARIPASYCGVASLKATHGLVPTFGLSYLDHTLDFICPIARDVRDVARVLEVIAGPDWRDPQPVRGAIPTSDYVEALDGDLSNLRAAVVTEGVSPELCDEDVMANFQRGVDALADAGVDCRAVSVPLWSQGWPISLCFQIHADSAMIQSDGQGYSHLGYIDVARQHAFGASRRVEANDFPPTAKIWLIAGTYLRETYHSTYLGKAQNLRIELRRQIEYALDSYDLLLCPTTPTVAPELMHGRATDDQLIARGTTHIDMAHNTSPLNLSGHPALAIPSGVDRRGLPTSIQLIGRHFDEATVLRAGRHMEQSLAL